MKKIIGKAPITKQEKVGNADCKLNSCGKSLVDVTKDYVHAVRVEDDVSEIQRDTMYIGPNVTVTLDVCDEVSLVFDSTAPDTYDALVSHMQGRTGQYCNEFFELGGIHTGGPSHRAIQIKINGMICGYYIPNLNSWLVGNWAWHIHYVDIIMKHLFPQMIQQLHIEPCENSITNGLGAKSTKAKRLTVTLGADPELELTKNGRVVKADSALSIRNFTSTDIGLDGAASQLEFRPKPGSPAKVVQNIRHLVKRFSEQYNEYDLTDAGHRYPLGGHIHVGLGHPIDIQKELVTMLDDFIGRPTIELSGDARSSYKFLGAVRAQPHGFEYRSTPSAVFQEPRMAHVTLTLMKNLCEHYFNQDTVSYSDTPTLHDYIAVGGLTKHQASYFMKFCSGYKPSTSIRASWKVEPAPVSSFQENSAHVPRVEFRDEWADDVEQSIRSHVDDNVLVNDNITISFYGLHQDRGEHGCTIALEDTDTALIESSRSLWSGNQLNIGFTRDIRRHGMGSTRRRRLIQNINRILSERSQ